MGWEQAQDTSPTHTPMYRTHPQRLNSYRLYLLKFLEPLTIISPAGDKPMGFHVIFIP